MGMATEFLIASFCVNFYPSGKSLEACLKGTEAALIQTGVSPDLNRAEDFARNFATDYVKKKTPQDIQKAVVYGATVVRFANGGDISFSFKIPDFCDRLELKGSMDTQSVGFNWNF